MYSRSNCHGHPFKSNFLCWYPVIFLCGCFLFLLLDKNRKLFSHEMFNELMCFPALGICVFQKQPDDGDRHKHQPSVL